MNFILKKNISFLKNISLYKKKIVFYTNSIENKNSTKDFFEIEKFTNLSKEWWNPFGPLKTLHEINPLRIQYIKENIQKYYKKNISCHSSFPLESYKILDVGCGCGILTESLARLGADVVGIDASNSSITIAKNHCKNDPLLYNKVIYLNTTAEELVDKKEQFDIVTCLEVLEHVSNVHILIKSLISLIKPGGLLFLSTLNKTYKSYIFAIIIAEYLLNLCERGTHNWNKFITPEEIQKIVESYGVKILNIQGLWYNPITKNIYLSQDNSVNYIMCILKPNI